MTTDSVLSNITSAIHKQDPSAQAFLRAEESSDEALIMIHTLMTIG
jgi:hypothetical protein